MVPGARVSKVPRAARPARLAYACVLAVFCLTQGSGCAVYRKCGLEGCPGDARITAEVQALFSQHPDLGPPNAIRVQTLEKVVYLTGVVSTDLQREAAESVTLQAPGVKRVVNSIALEYDGH
jgi:osmotically-inducible protein OsmY